MNPEQTNHPAQTPPAEEPKTFFGIIIHSFFVIPFMIAVGAVILFSAMHWLTREQLTAYDYLEQIRVGGLTKRWQAAFELSRMLANPQLVPQEDQFNETMISTFHKAKNDDPRVRQFLALAMARTGRPEFLQTIVSGLDQSSDETRRTLIHAMGMLRDRRAVPTLLQYLDHADARTRSMSVVALGNIGDNNIAPALRRMLNDPEANVRWGAAVSLAQLNDGSGKNILKELLNRNYLSQYSEVDPGEQTQIILLAISASQILNDHELNLKLKELSSTDPSMKVRATALSAIEK